MQAALILLPVVLLAGLASVAIRGDRRQLEERAREQAAQTARVMSQALATGLKEQLQRYLAAQRAWYPPLPGTDLPGPGALASWIGVPSGPLLSPPAGVTPEDWVLPEALVSPEGWREIPRLYRPVPQPARWWQSLPKEPRERWEAAVRLETSNATPAAVRAAWEGCREPLVNTGQLWDHSYDQNVLFQLRRLEASTGEVEQRLNTWMSWSANPAVTSPSGLPLRALALSEVLSLTSAGPLSDAVMTRLRESVTTFPSLLTPSLLERAAALDPGPEVQALQNRWAGDERVRLLLSDSGLVPKAGIRWIGEGSMRCLLVSHPIDRVIPVGSGERRETNRVYQVGLIPERAFVEVVRSALESSRSMIPGYAATSVTVLGRSMTQTSTNPKPALATATAAVGTLTALRLTVEVGLYWVDVDSVFREQVRRERWIAGFIGLAVLAAMVGVLQAWRTLRQQIALHEAKSNFVSAVSHELRAPLASVRLLAEGLARDGLADPAKRQEYGRFLVDETRRLGTLIENVLSLGRLEQGRRPLEIAPTDVRRLVHETVRRFEPLAAERGLVLDVDDRTGAEPLEAAWDGLAVQQALANLLDNALKHGPDGSRIQVTLERVPNASRPRIVLAVRDQGPGIPEEDHERIFDRFYRRGSELRRETRGVGLGLALVREIAVAHGGRVWVVSQPGRGADFRLELPLGDPTAGIV